MAQYFLNCLGCAQSLELESGQELDFNLTGTMLTGGVLIIDCKQEFISIGLFLLLHRGHPLMFTTKE